MTESAKLKENGVLYENKCDGITRPESDPDGEMSFVKVTSPRDMF